MSSNFLSFYTIQNKRDITPEIEVGKEHLTQANYQQNFQE